MQPRLGSARRDRAAAMTAVVLPLVLLLAVGCSENFGPPPPDANRRLPVVAEGFAGPVPARTLLSLAGTNSSWYLGTDAGLYRVESGWSASRTRPEHGGFADPSGNLGVSTVNDLVVDEGGRLVLFRTRFGAGDYLTGSDDAGSSYRGLPLPQPALQLVGELYAWPASSHSALGTLAVAQGTSLYLWREGASSWSAASLELDPVGFGPDWRGPDGRLWLAVDTGSRWAVLRSDDGGSTFLDTGVREDEEILALAHEDSVIHRITASGWRAGTRSVEWPGRRFVSARFLLVRGARQFAALGRSTTGGDTYLARGTGMPSAIVEERLAFDVAETALLLTEQGVVVGESDATLHRFPNASTDAPLAFAGGDLDWGAIATSASTGDLYLAESRSGVVHRGRADDPASMQSLGSPLFQSQPRALFVEPGPAPGVFVGSFGVHYRPPGSVVWQTRDDGQFSYLLENYSGPVKPRVIAAASSGALWLGAIQGDGPYRSLSGGMDWTPVHAGLGAPGSRLDEDGLPGAPQVNAFAFTPESGGAVSTWMATFRGGVWRLDDGATPVWEQWNRGLVDNSGAAVDSCCVDLDLREVDVRDLVALGDGTLLAATGNGAFRLPPSRVAWEASSLGLANTDLRALDVDPRSPSRVIAVATGGESNDTWLFYSEDEGRSWIAVSSSLLAKRGVDVVWSRPERNEVVAILETQGAWRVELMP